MPRHVWAGPLLLASSSHAPTPAGLSQDAKYGESLEGLRVILGVRPQVFNFVLPRLIKAPLMVKRGIQQLPSFVCISGFTAVASVLLVLGCFEMLLPLILNA